MTDRGEAHASYRELFERSHVGLFRTRLADGKILIANLAAARMFGYPGPEQATDELNSGVLYRNPEVRAKLVRDLLRNGSIVGREIELVRSDGSVFWARVSAILVADFGWIEGTIEDITEFRRSQVVERVLLRIGGVASEAADVKELIRRIRELLEEVLDTTNFYVALYDPAVDTYSFPYYEDERDELSEYENLPLKQSLTDYVRRCGEPALVNPERSRQLSEAGEVGLVGTDSRQWLGAPLRTEHGVIGVMAVQSYDEPERYSARDLQLLAYAAGPVAMAVERKRAEASRLEMWRRLSDLERLESLGVLAGGIAHDFNNLLQGIVGSTDLAELRISDPGRVADQLHRIRSAADSAAQLVRQMLAFSGRGSTVTEELDLAELIRDMSTLLRATVADGAEIDLRATRAPVRMVADAAEIRQMIVSLVQNASEALGGGHGTVSVSVDPGRLEAADAGRLAFAGDVRSGPCAVIEVTDDGAGMGPEVVGRIFDPFFSTKFAGRGMGLAAVSGLVRSLGGGIDVQTEVGRGTTVRILLPSVDAPADLGPASSVAAVGIGARRPTALVADDDESVRDIVTQMLDSIGFEVVAVDDGRAAVDAFDAEPDRFDVVLLDLEMPLMGGQAAFARIAERRPGVPVILSSGYAMDEVAAGIGDRQPAGLLQKPYRTRQLLELVRRISVPRSIPRAG